MKMPDKRDLKRITYGLLIFLVGYAAYSYYRISSDIAEKDRSCFAELSRLLQEGTDPGQIYKRDFDSLQMLVEKSLIGRSQMLEVAGRLRENKERPLASRDLLILKEGTEDYLDIREGLYNIATTYACAGEVTDATLNKYNIEPPLRLKALMLSLGAALTLYDNYMLGTTFFEHDGRLRKVINDPDMGFGLVDNKLREMTAAANSIESRHRIRRAINFYEQEKNTVEDAGEDSDFAYLSLLIESSASYNYVKQIRVKAIAEKKLGEFERSSEDLIAKATESGFDVLSGLFGNTIGLYEARRGKMFGDEVAKARIQSVLQPLDILLEKTPFRLTDKLIPGHFGHVAIWTGTKAELMNIGVWNDQHIRQYSDQICPGPNPASKDERQIIEALRSGVQLSTLDHFMNVDDLAILRPMFTENDKGKKLTKEALIMAFRQLGKKYDFNFDVNTTDKIVCSELAYVSFPSIDWPTQKTLGRYSISPDNVAQLAWNNVPLRLMLFYHDGVLVDESVQVEKMKELMNK